MISGTFASKLLQIAIAGLKFAGNGIGMKHTGFPSELLKTPLTQFSSGIKMPSIGQQGNDSNNMLLV